MSYYNIYNKYKNLGFDRLSSDVEDRQARQFISLLSPTDEKHLEQMAQMAHDITLRNFGRTIQLYTPLYLSNYCDNQCVYCGFSAKNDIERKRLTLDEVGKEAEFISSTGLKHILILTGESPENSPIGYIKDCVRILRNFFISISIEIYPLTEDEYAELISEGVDGLTIYQETYDEAVYKMMHPAGPKSDYRFRLDAAERGAKAGMRSVNIGVLLGLADWRMEAFFLGLHARYLQDKFHDVEIGVSLPRIRPISSNYVAPRPISDRDMVQMMLALRVYLPRLGITLSTRELPAFRDDLIGLGITRMSAGSTTTVGGRTLKEGGRRAHPQFGILDHRSIGQIKAALERKGYQPVLKDWVRV